MAHLRPEMCPIGAFAIYHHYIHDVKDITKALEMMKSDESLVLRLYYLCDLKIGEIMEITDFSESNIKVILHRGRKSMYEILEKLTGSDLKSLL